MSPRNILIPAALLFLAVFCSLASADGPAAKPDPTAIATEIAKQLGSPDAGQQQQGIAALRKFIQSDPSHAVPVLRTTGIAALMDGKRYDELDEICARAVEGVASETATLELLETARIQALLAGGKAEKALAHAKALYNISSMATTSDAMLRVAECLNFAHPDDFSLTERFRAQQKAGEAKPSGPVVRPAGTAANPDPSSVLGAIKIDPQEHHDAIAKMYGEDFTSLLAKGNLLLLSDRPHDAMGVFERAYGVATEAQIQAASEAVARAMKAEDATIGRANAWVQSIRPVAHSKP